MAKRSNIKHYLKEHQHKDTLAIYKLRNNKPLSKQDIKYLEQILWTELGSREQYENDYGDTPVLLHYIVINIKEFKWM